MTKGCGSEISLNLDYYCLLQSLISGVIMENNDNKGFCPLNGIEFASQPTDQARSKLIVTIPAANYHIGSELVWLGAVAALVSVSVSVSFAGWRGQIMDEG